MKSETEKREKEFARNKKPFKKPFFLPLWRGAFHTPCPLPVSHSFVPTKQQPYFELSGESSYCVFNNFPSTTVGLDAVVGPSCSLLISRYLFPIYVPTQLLLFSIILLIISNHLTATIFLSSLISRHIIAHFIIDNHGSILHISRRKREDAQGAI